MSSLDPHFRSLLLELAGRVETALGQRDLSIALVTHKVWGEGAEASFDVSLYCDRVPQFSRAMRQAFPRRATPPFRVYMGRFGDLNLERVQITHVQAALDRYNR
jgi:hypothetical protein